MRTRRICVLFCAVLVLTGCGVTFRPTAENIPVPAELRGRLVFSTVGAYRDHLEQLVGHILYARPEGETCSGVLQEADLGLRRFVLPEAVLDPSTEPVMRYQSIVSARIAAEATIMAFAASLNAESRTEVLITDTQQLVVGPAELDLEALDAVAAQDLPLGKCARYVVVGATLTTIVTRAYTKSDADATVNGSAFGTASGEVFAGGEQFALDYVLGLNILNLSPDRPTIRAAIDGGSLQELLSQGPADLREVRLPESGSFRVFDDRSP